MRAPRPNIDPGSRGRVASVARWMPALAALVAVGATACSPASAGERRGDEPASQEQEIGLLFAQTAGGGSMERVDGSSRYELTLREVNPQVVWFSDRPARQSGHVPVAAFVESWPGYGFVEDPPNAALSVLGADAGEDTVVVELGTPVFDEDRGTVTFPAEVLDGEERVAERFGAASLFVDDAAGKVIDGCTIQPAASCPEANLKGADLTFANLRGADLDRANLIGAVLVQANLRDANLHQAALDEANLGGADLTGADLRNASFERAELAYAKLTRARLDRADLTDADLSNADLTGATYCQTTMPDGSTRDDDC